MLTQCIFRVKLKEVEKGRQADAEYFNYLNQLTIQFRHVGVSNWGAPMWRAIDVRTRHEAANEMNDVPSFSSDLKR